MERVGGGGQIGTGGAAREGFVGEDEDYVGDVEFLREPVKVDERWSGAARAWSGWEPWQLTGHTGVCPGF